MDTNAAYHDMWDNDGDFHFGSIPSIFNEQKFLNIKHVAYHYGKGGKCNLRKVPVSNKICNMYYT